MAGFRTTTILVTPGGYDECPFSDKWHFCVEINRRNMEEPEEWAVSPYGFPQQGFTRSGKLVYLCGGMNRRHAIMSLDDARQLAQRLVEGHLETREFRTMATAMSKLSVASGKVVPDTQH